MLASSAFILYQIHAVSSESIIQLLLFVFSELSLIMVYFTCDACGEQLKKPNVEKHYQQKCRNCYKLTCIDCLKDFFGDEYQEHNACMSEAQRYSKEGRSGWDPTQGSVRTLQCNLVVFNIYQL